MQNVWHLLHYLLQKRLHERASMLRQEFFARLYNSEFQHSEDMQNAVLELNAECFAKYEQIFQRNLCAYLPIYTILLITTIIIQIHT